MMKAGMNIARLNFSHGNYTDFKKILKNIRNTAKKLKHPIAILQDLQGPKIRIGEMPAGGIELKNGQKIVLTTEKITGTNKKIPVQYQYLPKDVSKGELILIDDGLIELRVDAKNSREIKCTVEAGGILTGHKGINVPGGHISIDPITDKDKQDLKFGLKQGVDFVALSFVKSAVDILNLKKLIVAQKSRAQIIAKIERREAIENLVNIIREADAIMVARGDLGLEVPAAQVPILQKKMIHLANNFSKPVITATQMLDSMVKNPRASRAEISDIANAILDKTDAVMLSNESAVGAYPVRATQTLAEVAHEAEKMLKKIVISQTAMISDHDLSLFDATCLSATTIAQNVRARFIIAITERGYTARELAKHRIYIPIIAITPFELTKRQLQLVWGVTQCFIKKIKRQNPADQVVSFLKKEKIIKSGDEIVICSARGSNKDFIATIRV